MFFTEITPKGKYINNILSLCQRPSWAITVSLNAGLSDKMNNTKKRKAITNEKIAITPFAAFLSLNSRIDNNKEGNMPDKTIYTLKNKGKVELMETLRNSIVTFDFDTNFFSIAAFFIDVFEPVEQKQLLEKRVENLIKYLHGIENQKTESWENQVSSFHVANVNRMIDIVNAEISGTKRIIDSLR